MKERITQTVGSFPTMMDNLESRVMLSGNVAVSVVSGNLIVRGDASANSIVLNNAGRNKVRVAGADGTTINGAAGPVVMSRVHGLSLKLADGNDTLKLDDLTFDHVLPRSKGGKTIWSNIVTACSICNRKKANRTPQEAGMKLLKAPVQPSATPVLIITLSRESVPDAWRDYLYWTGELEA